MIRHSIARGLAAGLSVGIGLAVVALVADELGDWTRAAGAALERRRAALTAAQRPSPADVAAVHHAAREATREAVRRPQPGILPGALAAELREAGDSRPAT